MCLRNRSVERLVSTASAARVLPTLSGLSAGMQPLLKGELVDISIPFFEDHSLDAVWSDVNLFVEPSRLTAARPRLAVTLDIESVDALLREQSDLTFGPRMQQMEVWQVRPPLLQGVVEAVGSVKPGAQSGYHLARTKYTRRPTRPLSHRWRKFCGSEISITLSLP